MLILTINIGDKIRINDDIEITLLEERRNYIIKRTNVKIGINAPKNVNIRRSELPIRNKESK